MKIKMNIVIDEMTRVMIMKSSSGNRLSRDSMKVRYLTHDVCQARIFLQSLQ